MRLSSNQHGLAPSILHAARITIAYSTLYFMTFVNGLVTKKRVAAKYKSQNKTFDRYNSPEMQSADRLTQNFLEWYPVFMAPLWSLALTDQLVVTVARTEENNDSNNDHNNISTCVSISWLYVGLRVWYFYLILKHGVNKSGMNKSLWKSTFPAYFCLAYLHFVAIQRLFFFT
jgi:MAPEG family